MVDETEQDEVQMNKCQFFTLGLENYSATVKIRVDMWLNSSKYEKTCWGSGVSELDISVALVPKELKQAVLLEWYYLEQ